MFKHIFNLPALAVLSVIGSLWGLGYLAFGNARCQGINEIALAVLAMLGVIFIYITFAATDWLNDWIATRTVTKAQLQTNKMLTEQARTIAAQMSAGRKMAPQDGQQDGGLTFDPQLMDNLNES